MYAQHFPWGFSEVEPHPEFRLGVPHPAEHQSHQIPAAPSLPPSDFGEPPSWTSQVDTCWANCSKACPQTLDLNGFRWIWIHRFFHFGDIGLISVEVEDFTNADKAYLQELSGTYFSKYFSKGSPREFRLSRFNE